MHDPRYQARIVDELPLQPDEVVIEIGPGRGAITGLLAQKVRKVLAIELDPALAQGLQAKFQHNLRVEVITADVLRVNLSELCRQQASPQALVFGNIPYYITSPILHHVFTQRKSIRTMGLLMQREVAERLTARPGTRDYGYLTVATQLYSQPEIAFDVPPGAFSPPPKVQSALVTFRMQPKFELWPQPRCDGFLQFVKRCFAQKRKNLLNNLAGACDRAQIAAALQELGKSPDARAEELSVEELARLFLDR